MSQSERILSYLEKHGSITQMEAANELGCMRLGARIFELRERGHMIVSDTEFGQNRFGERTHYTRYRLRSEPC